MGVVIYMSRVIWFEIPADDPGRAAKFYEDVFGIDGAIMPKDMGEMVRDTIGVESYDEFAKKIEKEGGKMLTEKMTIPGMGVMGSFKDTEGNIFALMEPKMD